MTNANQIQSPLRLIGGFDSYQNRIYQEILKKVGKWTLSSIRKYDTIALENFPNFKTDGLSEGLLGLIAKQKPLTYQNLEYLQEALNFSITNLFKKELEPHLTSPNPRGISVPSLIIEDEGLHRRTAEYLGLIMTLSAESDRIISERNAA